MQINCENRARRRFNGFTLMELLIVMAIITILMLIAIPTTQAIFRSAHELSAKQSLKTIQTAQIDYNSHYPSNGYACSLSALGGDPSQGQPSATSAQLIPNDLATGDKDGYIIQITNCTKVTVNNQEKVTSYVVTAVPENVGRTGTKGFCLDSYGNMKEDPSGGTNCTQDVH